MMRTFGEILATRAEARHSGIAYRFLRDGETDEDLISYEALERASRAIGALLQERATAGSRVLLLYPSGLDFIRALCACLRSGVIAVPVPPPDATPAGRGLLRLHHIIRDCEATALLTTSELLQRRGELTQQCPELSSLAWIASDAVAPDADRAFRESAIHGDTIALLQYTSGSTAAPKGVVLSHDQIFANQRLIAASMRTETGDRGCGWLPLYHDMGLIGLVLHSLYRGIETVLMSPLHFLQQPLRWLSAISRYQATISGGPSFGYDLCVRRLRTRYPAGGPVPDIDLSSWTIAFNGAEPVRADVLENFAATFAPYGFRRHALFPCYGLAEATLLVTGAGRLAGPVLASFDRDGLEQGRARSKALESPATRCLVSSGSLPEQSSGTTPLIVDPRTMVACEDARIGEVWVRGPSVARRYWRGGDETGADFGATTSDGRSGFLRTGDLGFVADGQLFITGRLKEMLIIHGRNIYPQDIEYVAQASHPSLRTGGAAAVNAVHGGEDRLVLIHEVALRKDLDFDEVVRSIRSAVMTELQLQPSAVALVPPKTIPKTPSGKIQRQQLAARYLASQLRVLAEWRDPERWLDRILDKVALDQRSGGLGGEACRDRDPDAFGKEPRSASRSSLGSETWHEDGVGQCLAPMPPEGCWLILTDGSAVGHALSNWLRTLGARCVVVKAGSRFRRYEVDSYDLDPRRPDHITDLIRALTSDASEELSGIVDLRNTEDRRLNHAGISEVVRALARPSALDPCRLFLVTIGRQSISGTAPEAALEYPGLRRKWVDLDPLEDSSIVAELLSEILTEDGRDRVLYREGRRLVPRHVNISTPTCPSRAGELVSGASAATRDRPDLATAYVAPRTETERVVARIWQSVLGIDKVGATDPFFELGGDSVSALQILFELHQSFGILFDLHAAFEDFTVERAAASIHDRLPDRAGVLDDDGRTLVPRSVRHFPEPTSSVR
jgi:acyl-CoA synthetase (AMP-forming)/AMP-acid ligase II/acyl carrier protein